MSFSTEVKRHLCDIKVRKMCCRTSMLYGMLLTSKAKRNGIVFTTAQKEAADLAAFLTGSVTLAEAVIVERLPEYEVHIEGLQDADALYEKIPLYPIPKDGAIVSDIFKCPQCLPAFFRGLFIGCGSVTSPEKRYHLELSSTDEYTASLEALALKIGFVLKSVNRGSETALYVKNSSEIEDFLAYIGAAKASLEVMNVKISKDVRNDINRLTNCETANIDKVATAAALQLDAIRKLQKSGELEQLPPELRETARLRLENPELSLEELRRLFNPPISKSGVYHRLRKLLEAAGDLTEK